MSLSDVKALSNEYSRPEETFFNSILCSQNFKKAYFL